MSEVYAARRARLRERCHSGGSATALVTRPANVRYLAGAAPQGAVLLLGRSEDVLLCGTPPSGEIGEGRPDEAVRIQVLPGPGGDAAVAAADLVTALGAESLGVEEHHLTVGRHRAIRSVAPRLRLADLGGAVEQLRVIKDEEEIALSADRRGDRRPGAGRTARIDPCRPHRAPPRPGTGAPPRRPRRRRPGLRHLRRRRPELRPPRSHPHRPPGRGGRLPLRLPRRDLPRLPL